MTEKKKITLSDIGNALADIFGAIIKGRFILRLKIDKYFLHIAYTFLLFAIFILMSFFVDCTLANMEKNKKELKELEILYTQKRYELISLNRRSTVSTLLKEQNSKVGEPEKPAILIRDENGK